MKPIKILEEIMKMHRIKGIVFFFLTGVKCLELVLKHILGTVFTK